MVDRKIMQVKLERALWEKWVKLADRHNMPLVTYIKHLMAKELEKLEDRNV